VKVADGHDPPDFISGSVGLELVEWLDGDQMDSAMVREKQRDRFHEVLVSNWEKEHRPKNFRGAFPSVRSVRLKRSDEPALRKDFFACAAEVDGVWPYNEDQNGNSYRKMDFSNYPLLGKYFNDINFVGGEPHGYCWIHQNGDGGAFDAGVVVESLKQTLDCKVCNYSTTEKQGHLKSQALSSLNLLVHGGFNIYAYNTPAGHLTLQEIARRGADYYASHAFRDVFNGVWFFRSLDSADDVNQLMGFPRGYGRVRWLAKLWPDFRVYTGSLAS
jgi:hypothetical protein